MKGNGRTIRVGAAGLLTAGMAVATGAASPAAHAAGSCVPYVLPGLPGGGGIGEVDAISSTGVYGGAANGPDGHHHATYWRHSGTDMSTGWQIQQVPSPIVDDFIGDINVHGQMVGTGTDPATGNGVGYVFDSVNNTVTMLPGLGGGFDYDRRLNDSGVVAGSSLDVKGALRAVTWSPPYTAAHTLPDFGASQSYGTKYYNKDKAGQQATGIDNQGRVVGGGFIGSHVNDTEAFARSGQWRAAANPSLNPLEWQGNGAPSKLPTGNQAGLAWAINDSGLVVGSTIDTTFNGSFDQRPSAWINGVDVDMGAPADIPFGNAYGLSSGGWAAGGYVQGDNTTRAFTWSQATGFRTLDPPAGYDENWSHGVSDTLAQIGGSADNDDPGRPVPVVWQC